MPTTVVVFRNEKQFRDFRPIGADGKPFDWVAGYFSYREDANYIVLSIDRDAKQTFDTIYHEYIHFLINNTFGRTKIPAWFNEGLAEYYGQFLVEKDSTVLLGGLNDGHLDLLQRNKLMPIEEFLKVSNTDLQRQGRHSASIFYAQAWALMHYFAHGREQNRSNEINAYLQAIGRGASSDGAFLSAFKMSYAEMDAELRKYVSQNRFRGIRFKFNEPLPSAGSILLRPMTKAMVNAHLGDLLIGIGRLSDAEAKIRESLAVEPNSTFANSSMGSLKSRQRQFNEAKSILDRARRSADAGYIEHYRYALALVREPMTENGWVSNYSDPVAAEIRDAVERAIAMNPDFAESYSLWAWVSLVRNDRVSEAIDKQTKAVQLSPGDDNKLLDLAGLYSRDGNYETAKAIIDRVLAAAPENSDIRRRAQFYINDIERRRGEGLQLERLPKP